MSPMKEPTVCIFPWPEVCSTSPDFRASLAAISKIPVIAASTNI
jgi:hypothetical protein